MLARLLRRTLALHLATGCALGYGLLCALPWMPPAAMLLPVLLACGIGWILLYSLLALLLSFVLSRAADEPAAAWWRALAHEAPHSLRLFLWRQPWAGAAATRLQPGQGAQRVPVLLLHGYICNAGLWDGLAAALRARGHAVLAINLEPVFGSIDDYAGPVEAAVQQLCAQTGSARVALVGHSMGGLAIRAWMRAHGTGRVARAVTLGTPHAGTRVTAMVQTPNVRQMAWGSDWLQALAAQESAATRALFRVALSPQDNVVFPQRAQTLEGVAPTVFEGLGHLELSQSKRVIDWVCTELAIP